MSRIADSGRRLRLARQLAGYRTMGELSDATANRYSETRLSNYETGFRALPTHVAQDLGRVLNCSPAWLLCLDEAAEALSPEEAELLREFRAADTRGRTIIRRVADVVAATYRAEADTEQLRAAEDGGVYQSRGADGRRSATGTR